jgi:two-component system NtrC family sensor kinase
MNEDERSRPSILVVDDVEANLRAVEAVLDQLDCNIVLVQSGNEALRQLLKREFAALLLDVQMPEMDGYEVAHHARRNPATTDIPILFLTATTATEQNVLKGYGSGAVDYLFKPINATILRGKIRVFLDLYRSRRALEDSNARLLESNQELERAHDELRETQAQLVHSAKMASIGSLVAGVAHEVNNPLAFVISHLSTVRRSLSGALPDGLSLPPDNQTNWDRARHRLEEVDTGLERIRDIVVKLRTFSRQDDGEAQRFSIRECVDAVVTMLHHRCEGRITIETRLEARDQIDGYPGLMNQAIMNLVANAIDAIERAGTVTIATEEQSDLYCIMVSDDGSGIAAGVHDRIMDPFFTTKPVGQGTGLGLSITYSIAERHGGTLRLEPRAQGGTTATLSIPLDPGH